MCAETLCWNTFISKSTYYQLINHFKGNSQLIDVILNCKPKSVLEVGVGSGLTSVALAQRGIDVTCFDFNRKILSHVELLAAFFGTAVKTVEGDVKRLYPEIKDRFDVVYCQGLLEHFCDSEVVDVLRMMGFLGGKVVFEVPSEKWPYASSSTEVFGDERFLTRKHWLKLAFYAGLQVRGTYGWGLLPKYSRYNVFLPLFLSKRYCSRYGNNLGFVCERSLE